MLRPYTCTETVLVTNESLRTEDPDAHQAIQEWLRFHGCDPTRMPLGNTIVRDIEHCRITYDEYQTDTEGKLVIRDDHAVRQRVHAQGETPPLPFPPQLIRNPPRPPCTRPST